MARRLKVRRPIENRGSTARDHLANERTYLAWVRTALGLVGLGVVLERFAADTRDSDWAELGGVLLIALGGLALFYGIERYLAVARLLEQGQFPVARKGPLAVALVVAALSIGALIYVLL
ncbi:MAG: DUF202 domain-containing protein [Myxococcales bacterium]|nr:DUF202 domain-containing protein [Myxococcales bacterium]